MSSDSHTLHTLQNTITLVPLGTSFLHAPLISDELTTLIQRGKQA